MSKNISIKEGGVSKQMTVDKLKTNLVGGGTCLWVPEDGVTLKTKLITANGTYKASDDNCYGFSEVTVSGVGSVVGRDSNGNEAIVTADPVTGDLVTTEIPSSILVVMPPTTTTYTDGATIDFTGLVVKAYTQDGEVWTDSIHPNGEIPISELTLPVTVADYESVTSKSASSDLVTRPESPVKYGDLGLVITHGMNGGDPERAFTYEYTWTGSKIVLVQASNSPGYIYRIHAGTTNGGYTEHVVGTSDKTGEKFDDRTTENDFYRSYTHDGKTAYYAPTTITFGTEDVEVKSPSPEEMASSYMSSITDGEIAWTILYGAQYGGGQTIPVQWNGRGDGQTLETSFIIQVSESVYGGATGGGGGTSGGGAGRND